MVTRDELAARINNRQYRSEINKQDIVDARENNLVIITGASDDLIEFYGVVDDEIGLYEIGYIYITYSGEVISEDDRGAMIQIKYEFAPKHSAVSWLITTSGPHSKFNVIEDSEVFCKGIVIDLKEYGFE